MKKIGFFVGENGKWNFFREIYNDLKTGYTTEVYAVKEYNVPLLYGRLNRWLVERKMRTMLEHNDLCFFEWASELLVPASHMPKRCPIVTRLHSYELNVWAPKVNWHHVDKIIFVSQNIREKFIERYPEQANKTTVVYNGVALDKFTPSLQSVAALQSAATLNLGMLCWLHPVKRVYETIISLYELKTQGYLAHLHIAGGIVQGGYFDDYAIATHRLVKKLGLENEVTFYGHVSDPQHWFQNIDIFISNSYWEGLQVALLEAMASGCYCLSHAWDGAEEVVPREDIYITGAELQQKIIRYYHLPICEKQRLSSLSRTLACEKFDLEQTKRQIRQVIEETAASC
ncbi:MAG: glycosyltransferase family 4 protein [Caldilineaceae bacterium]